MLYLSQVAGVPVAHWSGNKSGISYSKNNPDVVVGGRNSVDLPSDARGLRRGMGRSKVPNRGRGLLPTPLFSPWPVDYDGKLSSEIYPFKITCNLPPCLVVLYFIIFIMF